MLFTAHAFVKIHEIRGLFPKLINFEEGKSRVFDWLIEKVVNLRTT